MGKEEEELEERGRRRRGKGRGEKGIVMPMVKTEIECNGKAAAARLGSHTLHQACNTTLCLLARSSSSMCLKPIAAA